MNEIGGFTSCFLSEYIVIDASSLHDNISPSSDCFTLVDANKIGVDILSSMF